MGDYSEGQRTARCAVLVSQYQWRHNLPLSQEEKESADLTTWIDRTVTYYKDRGVTKSRKEVKEEIISQIRKTRDAVITKCVSPYCLL
jgi:hypothetical protein